MSEKLVGVVVIEGDHHEEIVTMYVEGRNIYFEYGETTIVFDVKELLKKIVDEVIEEW